MTFGNIPSGIELAGLSIPEAAAKWCEYSWTPFPVRTRDKHPLIKWGPGSTALPTSPAEARVLFQELEARHGPVMIGIALPPDIVVLDIDHRPERGWQADEIRERLFWDFVVLGDAPEAKTPSGGRHVWLRLPKGATARNWTSAHGRFPVDGVDIRTKGGFVIVPPSIRADGGAYQWLSGDPWIPRADPGLARALQPAPAPEPIPINCSHGKLDRYVEVALERELTAVRLCPKGGRNDQLFRSSAGLGSLVGAGLIPKPVAERGLLEAASRCGLVGDDGPGAARATIASGLKAGMARPRRLGGAS